MDPSIECSAGFYNKNPTTTADDQLTKLADLVASRVIEQLQVLSNETLWTAKQVAAYARIHRNSINKFVDLGHLPRHISIGDNKRWDPKEVRRFLDSRKGIKSRRGRKKRKKIGSQDDVQSHAGDAVAGADSHPQ